MNQVGRRRFLIATGAFLAAPRDAGAQQTRKVFRVGFLSPVGKPGPAITALLQGLRELGYVEGRNLVIDVRYAEEKLERLPNLAAQLVQLKVDVLVPLGTESALVLSAPRCSLERSSAILQSWFSRAGRTILHLRHNSAAQTDAKLPPI